MRELVVNMSAAVVFQMWMVLFLGTMTGDGMAQVSTAKVMRGNIRRDGELPFLLNSLFECCAWCLCALCVYNCNSFSNTEQ